MRLIDADKLKEDFNQDDWGQYLDSDVRRIIDEAPTVEVDKLILIMARRNGKLAMMLNALRPHGKWITHQTGFLLWEECDQCEAQVGTIGMNYCPNCGAKMDEEADNEQRG